MATTTAARRVVATRYVTPLREGGSLPGLVEADDDGLYVVKFRGAGQGPRALVAEWLAGEIGRAVVLPVPDLVLIEVDPSLGDAEPDEEIHDLVRASGGLNLGLDFLPGALAFNRAADPVVGRRLRGGRRLARCLRHEPRSDRGQPQPARLARADVAHRPRRGAVYPSHLARPRSPRGRAVRTDPRPRPAAVRGSRSRTPTRDWRPGWTRTCSAPWPPQIPGRVAPGRPDDRGGRRTTRGVRPLPRGRLAGPRPFVEEAERARRAA